MELKDMLLKNLKELETLEKDGVVLISSHLISSIKESNYEEDKKRRLMEIAEILKVDTKKHLRAVKSMMKDIQSREL
jgi:hypothetical protein